MKSLINTIKLAVSQPRDDRMLHFSTDLQNPRHTCIAYQHGIPHTAKPWINTLPLLQGTAIHEEIHRIMTNDPAWLYAAEQTIMVEDYEYPWCGTVDAYLQSPDGENWLIDYKTISGASLMFLEEPKPEHIMQVSAYYHFGIQIPGQRVGILYLPTSADYKRRWHEPVFYEIEPLSRDEVVERMLYVEHCLLTYQADNTLPDPLEGEYSWKHNKRNKNWEYWYKPHYSSLFCPWKDSEKDLCGCSTQKAELIKVSEEDPNADVCS